MNTKMLNIKNSQDIAEAKKLLQAGELVAIPTETVYGLAADAKNPDAIQKIFKAKNRPANHPLILHIDSKEKLTDWAEDIPEIAYTLAKHFWPGPLTLVLKKKPGVSDFITGGLDTIAIRVPDKLELLEIMADLNTGLVAPSANIHTKLSPTSAEQVMNGMQGKIAAILDGGTCQLGIESTIVSLVNGAPKILRQGPITAEVITKKTGIVVEQPQEHQHKVSGNMLKHYQPNTKTIILAKDEIIEFLQKNRASKNIGCMYYSDIQELLHISSAIKVSSDVTLYAQALYQTLYELDKQGNDIIIVERPPMDSSWAAIWDRLKRATHQ